MGKQHFSDAVFRRRMRTFLSRTRPDLVTHDRKNKELKGLCAEDLKVTLRGSRKESNFQLFDLLENCAALPKPRAQPKPARVMPLTTKAMRIAFYDTDEWRRLRYRVLKANNGCCQCCGASAANGAQLHVDHIKPRSKFPELELEFANMQVLCRDCNLGKGAWDQTDWRSAAE